MPPRRASDRQMDLLAWEPPAPVARFEAHQVRSATIAGRIAHGVAATLRDAEAPREEIALRMGDYLGERVSKSMLDAYASEAREDHIISLPRLLALVHVTGDRRLLDMLAEPFGWAVVPERYLALIELAALREREDELRRRGEALRRRARAEGAL
jgi:hypothetical protein